MASQDGLARVSAAVHPVPDQLTYSSAIVLCYSDAGPASIRAFAVLSHRPVGCPDTVPYLADCVDSKSGVSAKPNCTPGSPLDLQPQKAWVWTALGLPNKADGWCAGKTPGVRVASAMLKAYGELRQLAPLLESLAAALGSQKCPDSARIVISDTRFQEALHKVCLASWSSSNFHQVTDTRAFLYPSLRASVASAS